MFYWLFQTPRLISESKLILWLSDKPGTSAVSSIFYENSPLNFTKQADGSYALTSEIDTSFASFANILYVDQPLGTGFSASNSNSSLNGDQIGADLLTFLLNFYKIHPEFKVQELIIAGNGYGAHYLADFATKVIEHNEKVTSESDRVRLNGVYIESGYIDPIASKTRNKNLYVSYGMLDKHYIPQYEKIEQD